MCLTWKRTNGPADADACDTLTSALEAIIEDQGATISGGSCSTNALTKEIKACADFATEASARAFGAYLADGGFDVLGSIVGFGIAYVIGPNGNPQCAPSSFYAELTSVPSNKYCDSWFKEAACAPPQSNNFPYCTCEPGATRKTPYSLSFKRKFVRGGNNYYCFEVKSNRTACGTSRCCGMDLSKIEWLSDGDQCMGSVLGFSVSTKPNEFKAPVWSREMDTSFTPAQQFGVFKTNNLGLTVSTANGAEVCFALRSTSKCPTLEQFCYQGSSVGCQYAFFDSNNGCCAEDWALRSEGSFDRRRFMRLL